MTPKILTVDDSRIVRMLISRALQGCDCQIVEATNGEEGLAAALRENPDLILLDVTMPVMDGFELLARLRQESTLAKVPVIMLTAESSQESVAKADGLGVSGYIAKPFKEEVLRDRINGIIALNAKS
jgi:CheY-like chemotaxis protein